MREIKFRAWDKVCKKYFYDGNLDNGDVLVIHLNGQVEISNANTYKPDDFILEQFTGLKDKNGKEIFEGDIVKFEDDEIGVGTIEYSIDGAVCFCVNRKNKYHQYHYFLISTTSYVVIGNIHENPELIQEDK